MRHRAALFGLLGGFVLVAALRPCWQTAALIAGFVSVLSFPTIAWSTGGYNAGVTRMVTADLVALACLVTAAAAMLIARRSP